MMHATRTEKQSPISPSCELWVVQTCPLAQYWEESHGRDQDIQQLSDEFKASSTSRNTFGQDTVTSDRPPALVDNLVILLS